MTAPGKKKKRPLIPLAPGVLKKSTYPSNLGLGGGGEGREGGRREAVHKKGGGGGRRRLDGFRRVF